MKELDKLVENYFIEKKAPELGMDMLLEMVEQSLEEAVYYDGNPDQGPIEIEKVAEDIIKFVKRKFPEKYHSAELKRTKGKNVIHFTNFGKLSDRDEVISKLMAAGYVYADDAEVKRSKLFHRAFTRYVDIYDYKDPSKPPKYTNLSVQFNSGGGPAAAGAQHEDEVAGLLTQGSEDIDRSGYIARKEGGSTALPDVILYDGDPEEGAKELVRFETKTVASADFGQFQIERIGLGQPFTQKTQNDSRILKGIFNAISNKLNNICNYNPQKSGELLNIQMPFIGELIEAYYTEKKVDYIIIKDDIYAASDSAQNASGLPRFKDSVSKGYVRVRVKCHGKTFSTTAALKIDPETLDPSEKYYEESTLKKFIP